MQNTINYNCIEKGFAQGQNRYSANMTKALKNKFIDIIVFSIPFFSFIEFKIVGRLFMSEIIIICLFPILLYNHRKVLSTLLPKRMIILMVLWLFGQIVTDLIRHTEFIDYIRGWAKISITLINFAILYILIFGNRKRIVLYAIGIAIGGILSYYFNPNIYADDYPWKFGIGESLTWLMIVLASNKKLRWFFLRFSIICLAALINIYMGFRSYGGICFLTAIYLAMQWLSGITSSKEIKLTPKNLAMIGLIIIVTSGIFIKTYERMVRNGLLGVNARQIYEQQALGDLGLLIGGRSEILVSIRAVIDSPIIGHGSWAKDYKYSEILIYLKRMLGYYPGGSNKLGLIPTHSHLFGAWVEAGILGAIFWIWVLFLPIRVMLMLIRTKEIMTPLVIFLGFLLIWDIFFSPFGAELRIMTPFYIIVIMSFLPLQAKRKHFERWE